MAKADKGAVAKMHPRNVHLKGYDFAALQKSCPQLSPFVKTNRFGNLGVDFGDPNAVKALNQALLAHHYGLRIWDIPPGYLCPPIPGRVDYIHHLADLLAEDQSKPGKSLRGLDIGTGANAIYALLGHLVYQWRMCGSDIDSSSVANAQAISKANPGLAKHLEFRQQKQDQHFFRGIIKVDEYFDFTLCNPPFHRSAAEAAKGSIRKNQNLAKHRGEKTVKPSGKLNFAGQSNELWCKGGELSFITAMARESQEFAKQVGWFTTLVSKSENLRPMKLALRKIAATEVRVVKMAQGQKQSRFIAWRF